MRARLRVALALLLAFSPILNAQGLPSLSPIPPMTTPAGALLLPNITFTNVTVTGKILLADGTLAAPSLAFSSSTNTGLYTVGAGFMSLSLGGADNVFAGANSWRFGSNVSVCFNSTTTPSASGACDITMTRGAAGQILFSTTGNGNGLQLRSSQTLPPVCYVNCGTAPTVTGTDSDMKVTMGASGVPASLWQVGFRGTWATAPPCIGQMALGTMANTKLPIVIATTTGGLTVTTNGAAPANSDVYAIHCGGVS